MKYSSASSWEKLQRRFPRHPTEEKLAQFSTLKFKGKVIPLVNKNWLKIVTNFYNEVLCVCAL